MIIKESLGDLLRPKKREDINKELNKYTTEQKLEAAKSYFEHPYDLLSEFNIVGADFEHMVRAFLISAKKVELMDIINDLYTEVNDEEYVIDTFISYMSGANSDNDRKRINNVFNNFIKNIGDDELNDLLNDVILNHHDIVNNGYSYVEDEW